VIARLQVQLLAGQVVHTHGPVIKQYNLIAAESPQSKEGGYVIGDYGKNCERTL